MVVVNRDIRELARLSPLATANTFGDGGISIAGSNPRTNRVTIDGVAAQDDFGLNTGGLPTRRGPVSVDAISQFNISATPFDVRNGGFLGGAIDLVLASGDNKLHGTLFGKFQDEKLTGSWIDGTRVKTVVDQTNYGATLRGPILKDKLFYALSYETFETSDGNSRGPADKGFVSTIVGPTGANLVQADIDAITNIYYNTYKGDRALGEIAASKPVTDEKYSLRLDYNITDKQRAAYTYRKATSEVFNFTNLGATTASLDSQWYMTGEDDESYTLQLNSAWNQVKFYRAGTEVFSFDPTQVLTLTGNCPGGPYCGRPEAPYQDGNADQPYVFLNFYDQSGLGFDKISFFESPAVGGYESDNHTVGFYKSITGEPVPEPSSFALLGLALAGLAATRRRG